MRAKHLLLVLMAACAPGIACAEDTTGPTLDRSGLEFGGRYWYSTGRIGYNYYGDTTTTLLVSRLTYDQLTANAGEFYFRGDVKWGFFVKGFVGAGGISGGRLIDEDLPFPPASRIRRRRAPPAGPSVTGLSISAIPSFASPASGSAASSAMGAGMRQ